ncbi:SulP family inorganic anion transporter [Actinomarinicola tropica]|uniref:Sulfate permease n=1 Tax=Actinomarinicola tropica TaxID=2789776 RepID=A0A5Q2RJ82_9ACTN|nr:solute carrier family 26 protein [Actinomarinicola tropica]QGG94446.1 sulfate permease [Actinomarinicola tropica]
MRALTARLPILGWLPRYQQRDLNGDLTAGLTVAAMLIPQGMAYAMLAGMPPEAGLYASTVPLVLYALIGTSRQLAVGPVAIMSLLTASAIAPLAEEGTARYVELAALLAVMVAVIHFVLGALKAGWVVNFLSHPVLVGYTAAAAIIIGTSQVKHLLGITMPSSEGWIETVTELVRHLGEVNWTTVAVGVAAIALLVGLKRWKRTFPSALAVVALTTGAVQLLSLEDRGVKVLGEIPSDLPMLAVPSFDSSVVGSLLPAALVITLAGFMESIAIAKVFARKNRYEVDANQELIGLGSANLGAGFFGGFPVTGGFSRTAVNAQAGARTPLASLITVAIILVALVLLTPYLESLPSATLGAIVVVAVASLVDWREARHIAHVNRADLVPMAVAFVATLALGIELGIGVAVVTSLGLLFLRLMKPHTAVLGRIAGTHAYRNVDRFPTAERIPGVTAIRLDTSVNFVNVAFVKRRLTELVAEEGDVDTVVIDFTGVNDLDASGDQALHEILDELTERGVDVHLATVKGPVRDVMMRSGLWQRLGRHVHLDVDAAMESVARHEPRLEAAELVPPTSVIRSFRSVSA